MSDRAGAALSSMAHDAATSIEQAADALHQWLGGLHASPAPVPPVLHPVVPPARAKAQRDPMPPGEVADPKTMSLSERGRQFIFRHEAGNGHATAHLHHPLGHSGVTIGPGLRHEGAQSRGG